MTVESFEKVNFNYNLLLKEANFKKHLSPLKVSFFRKPPENGQVESMEADTDENDDPATSVSDANESGETPLSIGRYIFMMWDFFFFFFFRTSDFFIIIIILLWVFFKVFY